MSSKEVRLGDIADLNGGYAFKSGDYRDSGVFVLRTVNIKDDGSITKEGATYISEEDAHDYMRFYLEPLDTLFVMVGATLGKTGLVQKKDLPALLNQNMWVIRTKDPEQLDPLYLYYKYSIESSKILKYSTGAARDFVRRDDFRNIKFILPEIEEQREIAKILGDLDRKIELNRKMNERLEQIGQALFKKYFIEFSLDSKMTIGDVATVIDCLHSKKPELSKENTGFIFLQLNNILDNGLLDLSTKFYVSKDDYIRWTSRIEVKENDFVITNVGRSGAVAKIPQGVTAAMGRNMTAIRLRDDFNFPGFLSFALNSSWMKEQIESKLDHGTILSALNVKSIPTLKLPGAKDQVSKYEHDFLSLRKRIENNHLESSICANLRDSLLPRIMNGQITV